MFLSKVCCNLSKRSVVNRLSIKRALPTFCSSLSSQVCRRYSDGKNDKSIKSDKYKIFKDDDSSIILDVEEERALLDLQVDDEPLDFEEIDQFAGFNTTRE